MIRGTSVSKTPQLTDARQWLKGVKLPEKLAVAWSGGADSTALLLALSTLGYKVHAWHVDHAWHKRSSRHAAHLEALAWNWGIPFYTASVSAAPTANREAEARRARMNQFGSWAREQEIGALCLAHHMEDQAETVCLRMLQGAGVAGCRGMAALRRQDDLTLMRPLLHMHKHELEGALQRAGVSWLEDPSNKDVSLLRNCIRHTLFPVICKADADPVGLYLRWQRQAVRVSDHLDSLADDVALRKQADRVSVNWTDWTGQPAAVRAVVLQRMAEVLMGAGTVLGRRHIQLIEQWLQKGGRGGLDLSRCRITHQQGSLNLFPKRVSLR